MDEQVELLRGIWNEMKALNGRIEKTNDGLAELRGEVRTGLAEVRGEVRTGLAEVRAEIGELRAEVRTDLTELRDRIDATHSRSVHRDMRLAGSISQLALDVRDLTLVIHEWHDDQRLGDERLEGRVDRIERHLGLEPR